MTVIETAWNNLTPSQQQNTLDIYGREDYAAVATPLDGPLTPHPTSEDWRDKDYGEENPAPPTVPHRNRNQPHAPKRQPKTKRQPPGRHRHRQQIHLLPTYDFNHNTPDTTTPLQYAASNLTDLLRRTTTDNDERPILQQRGVDKTPTHRLHS